MCYPPRKRRGSGGRRVGGVGRRTASAVLGRVLAVNVEAFVPEDADGAAPEMEGGDPEDGETASRSGEASPTTGQSTDGALDGAAT